MQSFASLVLLLSITFSSVMASPVDRRATALSCESTPATTRRLFSEPYVFSLGNTTKTDHYGNKAKVLISSADDGTPFNISSTTETNFDFYSCNSTYMNTEPTGSSYELLLYGILRPQGQTQHCLQASSGSVDTADQVITNSYCSYVDDKTQQDQTWSYFPNDGTFRFISTRVGPNQHQHPTYFTRSEVGHNALKLNAGSGDGLHLGSYPSA